MAPWPLESSEPPGEGGFDPYNLVDGPAPELPSLARNSVAAATMAAGNLARLPGDDHLAKRAASQAATPLKLNDLFRWLPAVPQQRFAVPKNKQ